MSKSKKTGARRAGNPAKRAADPAVRRLYDRAQPSGNVSPLKLGGGMVDVTGDPHAHGGVVVDVTDALLLGNVEVALIDQYHDMQNHGLMIMMTLGGRINKTTTETQVGVIMGSDGGASIIANLLGVASRYGMDALKDLTDRLIEFSQDGHLDLQILKVCVDIAIEQVEHIATIEKQA